MGISKINFNWLSKTEIFFLIYLLIGLSIVGGYGVSWDEPVSRINGLVNLKYISDRLGIPYVDKEVANAPLLHQWMDRDYGVAFELPLVILEKYLGIVDSAKIYFFRHQVNFLVYFSSVLCLYKLIYKKYRSTEFALYAVIIFILSPRIFAESFYNSKDIIFLSYVIISHYFFINFIYKKKFQSIILSSMFAAMAINVRIIAIIFPLWYFLILILENKLKFIWWTISYCALVIALTVLFFPFLWDDPQKNIRLVIENMSNFRWRGDVLFEGEFVKSYELPWYYLHKWILITTPLTTIFLTCIGLVGTLTNLKKYFRTKEFLLFEGYGIYCIIIIFSLIYFKNPVMYDGWRQFYFLIFPIFIFATHGLNIFYLKFLKNISVTIRLIATIFIGCHAAYYTFYIYNNHPHQNVYFNFLAGSDIIEKYELDYWGVGNLEAIKKILIIDRGLIEISSISSMPLQNAVLKLPEKDRLRIKIIEQGQKSKYLITNYRQVRDKSDIHYLATYSIFTQIVIDGNKIITVFKKND